MPASADALPTLAVLGDSHADPFLGAYVRDASGTPRAVAHVAFLPLFTTEGALDGDGRIHPQIVAALAALRLLTYATADDPDALPPAVAAPNAASPPWGPQWKVNRWLKGTPLLVLAGEVSARFTYNVIPPQADVQVPFAPERLARIPRFTPEAVVSAESLEAVIAARLQPLFRALTVLRDAGLGPLALHSISPCTPDDELARTLNGASRALTRYKVIMLFNAALAEWCRREGVLYIDRWDEFTDGGLVRDGYLADAVHVKEAHMRESLARLYDRTLGAAAAR